MLHNCEASPADVPPSLAFTLSDVHSQTWPAPHTVCGEEETQLTSNTGTKHVVSTLFTVIVVDRTVCEEGLWFYWLRLLFFHYFWFRLRWLIVHCAAHWRIPIIQSTHQLQETHKNGGYKASLDEKKLHYFPFFPAEIMNCREIVYIFYSIYSVCFYCWKSGEFALSVLRRWLCLNR